MKLVKSGINVSTLQQIQFATIMALLGMGIVENFHTTTFVL